MTRDVNIRSDWRDGAQKEWEAAHEQHCREAVGEDAFREVKGGASASLCTVSCSHDGKDHNARSVIRLDSI